MKHKITLIRLGHINHLINFNTVIRWKSELFTVVGMQSIENLPAGNIEDGYLDVKYDKGTFENILSCPEDSDYAIAVMPYRFVDGFYMHRVNTNCVVISIYGIADILRQNNVCIEHFIIKQLYEVCAIKHLMSDLTSDSVYDLVHKDTRGCLFDLNGDHLDILHNTESPIICDECKTKFKTKQTTNDIIVIFEKELKRIKKPFILRAERWIAKYPFVAITLSVLTAIFLNILANLICQLFIS